MCACVCLSSFLRPGNEIFQVFVVVVGGTTGTGTAGTGTGGVGGC